MTIVPSCQGLKCCAKNLTALQNYRCLDEAFTTSEQKMAAPNSTASDLTSSRMRNILQQAHLINTTDLVHLSQTREYKYKKWFVVQLKLINCLQMQLTLCKQLSWCS